MLAKEILKAIEKQESYITVLSDQQVVGKHEMVFFLKPEVLSASKSVQQDKVIDATLEKLKTFNMNIVNVKVIKADYLKTYDIMAQHYGVIGQIATNAQLASDKAKEKFESIFTKKFTEVQIFGGLEFITKFPQFNSYSLDVLWQNNKIEKLAGGTYVQEIKIDDESIYLMNGFFPRYVEHFTGEGRYLVLFTLRTDLDWKEARQNFIGATDPESANKGSLRHDFYERASEFGLDVVNRSSNGAHLSAGPLEALVELIRFNSNNIQNENKSISDYQFGSELELSFNDSQIKTLLNNGNLKYKNEYISSYDISEEVNALDTLEILKQSEVA